MKIKKFNENIDDETRLNWIIDKISNFGKSSLTKDEQEFLNQYSGGDKNTTKTPQYDHYNKYIISLLNDVKQKNITESIAKNFIKKHINNEELFDFLLSLLKDGKLDFLTDVHNINNDIQ